MARHFTIHARLIKGCNADCSYCSSWSEDAGGRMSPADFATALRFLRRSVFPAIGVGGPDATVSIQYVGGEILLVPTDDLRECVEMAREEMSLCFGTVRDGVQSNLVGSERRILALDRIFGGNIGTSVDGRGVQRTVKGSPEAYRKAVARSRGVLSSRRGRRPGATFVVDDAGVQNVPFEMASSEAGGYPLTLRPVFSGGRPSEMPDVASMANAFASAFDGWAMKGSQPVEPFAQLAAKRVAPDRVVGVACPFMRDCAQTSIDIEPDGSLYTCFEMADAGRMSFGNALEGHFDRDVWETVRRRASEIDPKCAACPWFDACQGGCMNEAIEHTGSTKGRTAFCPVWTAVFERIDDLVKREGRSVVAAWLSEIGVLDNADRSSMRFTTDVRT